MVPFQQGGGLDQDVPGLNLVTAEFELKQTFSGEMWFQKLYLKFRLQISQQLSNRYSQSKKIIIMGITALILPLCNATHHITVRSGTYLCFKNLLILRCRVILGNKYSFSDLVTRAVYSLKTETYYGAPTLCQLEQIARKKVCIRTCM